MTPEEIAHVIAAAIADYKRKTAEQTAGQEKAEYASEVRQEAANRSEIEEIVQQKVQQNEEARMLAAFKQAFEGATITAITRDALTWRAETNRGNHLAFNVAFPALHSEACTGSSTTAPAKPPFGSH